MLSRPWTKKIKANHRVEIRWKRYYGAVAAELEECQEAAIEINKFLQEHKDMDDFYAVANYDNIEVCQFCNEPYEEDIFEGKPVCANCGKGAKEAMLEKLDGEG